MKCHINGTWTNTHAQIAVINPFDQSTIDSVPSAGPDEIELALSGAVSGAEIMKATSAFDRSVILRKTAKIMSERIEDLAETISLEEGKTIREATGEVRRAISTLELSAEEARRISGETLPLDGEFNNQGKTGFTLRVPCGVVVAITPFNFPLNLVCHKVGPALAAGNSVILKPAEDTPLSALKFIEILLDAGCPPLGISCITGTGPVVGAALCQDPRVRKISFTGSREVGEQICKMAGIKRVTMELGSNSPLVVLPDANLEKVTETIASAGYANAGQVCISAQRIIIHQEAYDELADRLKNRVAKIKAGDQTDPDSNIGPMVRERDAIRVESWIEEAVQQGANLVLGGKRNKTLFEPSILTDVTPDMKVVSQELFGPAICLIKAANIESAIQQVNDSPYGLSAAVFTQDIDKAMQFAKQIDSGNIHINGGPMWRSDGMPYGGLKQSGLGKEGPRYAIEEMTELKAVIIH